MRYDIPNMRFKNYEFPNNPSTCRYSCERDVVAHRYPELSGSELEDLGPNTTIISGNGEFFGKYAYDEWRKLLQVFKSPDPGIFIHPIYGDITLAVFKKLESTIEPRPEYVSYSFEFWEHTENKVYSLQPNKVNKPLSATDTSKYVRYGDKGAIVMQIQKKLLEFDPKCLPKYGADGKFFSETEAAVRKFQSKHKLQVDGIVGPKTFAALGITKRSDGDIESPKTSKVIYIVKKGDTLSGICSRYGVDWKAVAKSNNIKNPRVIQVGQKIVVKG